VPTNDLIAVTSKTKFTVNMSREPRISLKEVMCSNFTQIARDLLATLLHCCLLFHLKIKQDRQSSHNVTLRRVHETTVAVEKQ
jgi:hypothetical protein